MISKEELLNATQKFKADIDFDRIIQEVDMNQDGYINYSEFLMVTYDFRKQTNLERIEQLFRLIDEDSSCYITKQELKKFLNIGDNDFLNEIFIEVDCDSDNRISFDEFKSCMINLANQN